MRPVPDRCGNPDLDAVISAFVSSDQRVHLWRRWPDVSAAEDAFSDSFACGQVSESFTAFARKHGWTAATVAAEDAEHPFADYHYWSRLTRGAGQWDVDFTARQFHNLHEEAGRDPKVLSLAWPLVWPDPDNTHPAAGKFARVRVL